jgi:hypothetical protein
MISEILSSYSLLVAVLTIIYSLWYQKIIDAIDSFQNSPLQPLEIKKFITEKKKVLNQKSRPLFMGGFFLTLLMLPDIWSILKEAYTCITDLGLSSFSKYNSIKALLFLAFIFLLYLTAHLFLLNRELKQKIVEKVHEHNKNKAIQSNN